MVTATPTQAPHRQLVFAFDEGDDRTRTPEVRGGKGAHLAQMVAMGLPVPPGFTITTTVARYFMESGQFADRFGWQFKKAITDLEMATDKRLGDPFDPLLVSVRSGAAESMPGMMDTVLNVGLNPATVEGLARCAGDRFAWDSYRRFLALFGQVVLDVPSELFENILECAKITQRVNQDSELSVDELKRVCQKYHDIITFTKGFPVPDDPYEQLDLAIRAVLRSWMSERAVAYRKARNLSDWAGTAVNIQAMVFGNHGDDSGTGVVFSHDVTTGLPGLYGEFLPNAQGEDVVAGVRTPYKIAKMKEWAPSAYRELECYVNILREEFNDIVDIEFTVESGRLFLLQVRRAKRTARAAATFAVHQVWAKKWSREQALEAVSTRDIILLRQRSAFDAAAFSQATHTRLLAQGLPASPGAVTGRVARSSVRAERMAKAGHKVILVRRDTSPEDLPGMLVSAAIVTSTGGMTSHAAVVARELNLPAVVGASMNLGAVRDDMLVSVDGTSGTVVFGEVPLAQSTKIKEVELFLRWHAEARNRPTLRFDDMKSEMCVNTMLNDFYLSEAMAQAFIGTALEADAYDLRDKVHRRTAEYFAMYFAVAVSGELRHMRSHARIRPMRTRRKLERTFRVPMAGNRAAAQQTVIDVLEQAGPDSYLEFFQAAETMFYRSRWSASFGGKKWGAIARAARKFFDGTYTATMFVDHAFDLRHNGGTLFDKHPMVATLTHERLLVEQLDVKKRQLTAYGLWDVMKETYRLSQYVSRHAEVFGPEVLALWNQRCIVGMQ